MEIISYSKIAYRFCFLYINFPEEKIDKRKPPIKKEV
jgi:hypothetical protein